MRSEEAEFLTAYPNACHLFFVMAQRARRTDHPLNGLKAGQCFLGDIGKIGLTEQQYRTAKKQLAEWNLATFKGTNKGTVGTIINSKVYDINAKMDNEQPTSNQRAPNDQLTTNKECKKERMKEPITSKKTNKKDLMSDESDVGIVLGYFNQVCSQKLKVTTKAHTKNINARLNDGYTVEDCKAVIDFKYRDWAGTKRAQYLRPSTLFAASKFPGYLQGSKSANLPKTEKHDVSPSEAFRLELAVQGRRVDF